MKFSENDRSDRATLEGRTYLQNEGDWEGGPAQELNQAEAEEGTKET